MNTNTIPDFYTHFPMLQPYVGPQFGLNGGPSILLVGESHYLPNGATAHRNAEAWYDSHAGQLSDEERRWISTSEIFREGLGNRFANRAFSIWKNALWEINASGFRYDDYIQAGENIASYNFFLRPAEEGCSLQVVPEDVRMANEALAFHCRTLRPSAVIILSRLAARHIEGMPDIPSVTTPHPGCSWWNRKSDRYGGNRGRDLLSAFVSGLDWRDGTRHAAHQQSQIFQNN
jgi:hypothetical protein